MLFPFKWSDGTYSKFAICTPVGFGIKKSFHSTVVKLEAGLGLPIQTISMM